MASAGPPNPDTVASKVKTLISNQLKQVLKKEGLPVSGVKATLQTRIIDRESLPIQLPSSTLGLRKTRGRSKNCFPISIVHVQNTMLISTMTTELHNYARKNDLERFNQLRNLVYNPDANPADLSPSPSTNGVYGNNSLPPALNHYPQSFGSSMLRPGAPPPHTNGSGPSKLTILAESITFADRLSGAPQYKMSPFFSVLEPLTPILECKGLSPFYIILVGCLILTLVINHKSFSPGNYTRYRGSHHQPSKPCRGNAECGSHYQSHDILCS